MTIEQYLEELRELQRADPKNWYLERGDQWSTITQYPGEITPLMRVALAQGPWPFPEMDGSYNDARLAGEILQLSNPDFWTLYLAETFDLHATPEQVQEQYDIAGDQAEGAPPASNDRWRTVRKQLLTMLFDEKDFA